MEFYAKQSFDFDEDTTDTEDDSGIAEISSSYNNNTNNNSDQQYCDHRHGEDVPLDLDALDTTTPPGLEQQPQSQDALGRFFSYWWVNEFESQ